MKVYTLFINCLILLTVTNLITAYPNKVTFINNSPTDAVAYVTTLQPTPAHGSEVSQTVPNNGKITFKDNTYTKIKIVGRIETGSVSGGNSSFQSYADVEALHIFEKDFSGEITLLFDASGNLKVINRENSTR